MSRIRSIKPEFWTSEQVMECSTNARLLFIGMWNFADDCGRLPMAPKTIKAQIFPGDNFDSDIIIGMIEELLKNGLLLGYEVGGKEFLQVTGWQHQRIDKPQPAKFPAPINGYSKTIPRMVATEGIGKEGIGKDIDSEAKASDAKASSDPRADLFDRGLKTLARLTGKGPDSCRSFVGKCLKAASDDAVTVLGLIEDADRNRVADPSAWISGAIKARSSPQFSAKPLTEFQRKQVETNDVRRQLQILASGSGGGAATDWVLPSDPGERSENIRGGSGSTVLALSRVSDR